MYLSIIGFKCLDHIETTVNINRIVLKIYFKKRKRIIVIYVIQCQKGIRILRKLQIWILILRDLYKTTHSLWNVYYRFLFLLQKIIPKVILYISDEKSEFFFSLWVIYNVNNISNSSVQCLTYWHPQTFVSLIL